MAAAGSHPSRAARAGDGLAGSAGRGPAATRSAAGAAALLHELWDAVETMPRSRHVWFGITYQDTADAAAERTRIFRLTKMLACLCNFMAVDLRSVPWRRYADMDDD